MPFTFHLTFRHPLLTAASYHIKPAWHYNQNALWGLLKSKCAESMHWDPTKCTTTATVCTLTHPTLTSLLTYCGLSSPWSCGSSGGRDWGGDGWRGDRLKVLQGSTAHVHYRLSFQSNNYTYSNQSSQFTTHNTPRYFWDKEGLLNIPHWCMWLWGGSFIVLQTNKTCIGTALEEVTHT